ncbi:hypothetical protein Ancab_010856 [Ancistrocladus abbreviatus]
MSTRRLNTAEDQNVQGERHHNLVDVLGCISSLEGCFLDVQRGLEEWFGEIYSDVILMVEDAHCCVQGLKSALVPIFLELMATDFSYSVLHACVGENLSTMLNFSGDSIMFPFRQENICLSKDGGYATIADVKQGLEHRNLSTMVTKLEKVKLCRKCDNLRYEFLTKERIGSSRSSLKRKLEQCVAATQNALSVSSSELEQVERSSALVPDQNAESRLQTEDLYQQNWKLKIKWKNIRRSSRVWKEKFSI